MRCYLSSRRLTALNAMRDDTNRCLQSALCLPVYRPSAFQLCNFGLQLGIQTGNPLGNSNLQRIACLSGHVSHRPSSAEDYRVFPMAKYTLETARGKLRLMCRKSKGPMIASSPMCSLGPSTKAFAGYLGRASVSPAIAALILALRVSRASNSSNLMFAWAPGELKGVCRVPILGYSFLGTHNAGHDKQD